MIKKVRKNNIERKLDGLIETVDKFAISVGKEFKRVDERFELADKKVDDLRTDVSGRFTDINGKFFEVKDQLNLLQNKMERVEKLFDKNDTEHKVFRTKIEHLEKI